MIGYYVDHRVGGVERWAYGDPRKVCMRVPDLVAHNPVFLVVKDQGRERMVGTAFLMYVPAEKTQGSHGYLVTARHCVEKSKPYWPLFVRMNRRVADQTVPIAFQAGAADLLEIEQPNWVYHPDETNDVAVLPGMPQPNDFLFVAVGEESWATADVIEREAIGIGDDLMIVGLFASHHGRSRNRPIVRSGIIAAMADEPLQDTNSGEFYDAYLAEVRSVGGLSGSPVWVVMSPARVKPGPGPPEFQVRLVFYLLGLVRGHWNKDNEWLADFAGDEQESLNTGIAIVTPIQKALDIINSEEFVKERKRREREMMKDLEGDQVLDAVTPVDEQSEFERFEDLTHKLVNTPKPANGQQEDATS